MQKRLTLVFLVLLAFLRVDASEQKPYELPRTQVIPIKSTETAWQYELYVKLPDGYAENKDVKYPVIYFTDAVWHIEMLSASTEFLMEDVILVGISWQKDINEELVKERGAHVSRFRDYSIRKSNRPEHQAKYQFGQAENHLNFIRNDVIEYIEKNYRTEPDFRSYFGYSLGGEFGAYILLKHPNTFKNYVLGSPSLKGEIPYLTELASNIALKGKGRNANVFISYGSLEKELGEYADQFITLLKASNDKSLSLKHVVIEGSHLTAFPMTGVRSVTWLSNLQQQNYPVLEGPYLGQKLPGLTPEVFAPRIVSTEHRDHSPFFTPDMKEFYFTRKSNNDSKWSLIVFKSENNRWRKSVVGPRVGRPNMAPDGKTMHLGSKYMERTESGWSEVKSLGPMFDREDWGIMRLSSSATGTYVFDDYKSNDIIRISKVKDGKRQPPSKMGPAINTGKYTAHPFIAPDESYLIWDSERDIGYGNSDLYISFRQHDGAWGPAINLGNKINTSHDESGGYVTPDGKYLFYNTGGLENRDIYWVDAQIIETLRPKS